MSDSSLTKNDTLIKNNINILEENAKSSYYEGNWDTSEQLYTNILEENNNNIEAIKNLIFIYKQKGNYNDVIYYYEKLISLQPDNIIWKYEYGITLYQIARYKEAKTVLSNLTENYLNKFTQRDQALLYYYNGKCNAQLNKYEEALADFSEGIYRDSSLILNYLGKAEVYQIQENYEKALNYYMEVIKWDPSLSPLYPQVAQINEKLENYQQAYDFWKKTKDSGIETIKADKKLDMLKDKVPELKKEEAEEKEEIKVINFKDISPVKDVQEILEIRVGLIDRAREITFISKSDFKILNSNNEVLLNGKGKVKWKIRYEDNYFQLLRDNKLIDKFKTDKNITIKPEESDSTTILYNINYGTGYFWAGNENRQYRGQFELNLNRSGNSNNFSLINIINLEEYLFSVVPAEMPAWWPQEALKSQAIAARSYALYNIDRHQDKNYNLCATVHCAVYKGTQSEHNKTTEAVLQTRGEVATYEGEIINAVFSSNSGGYTENSDDIWQSEIPYLTATSNMKTEDFDFPLSPYNLKKWLQNKPPSYSYDPKFTGHNKYRWVRPISINFLEERYDFEKIINIFPLKTSYGGSIESILLKGKNKDIIIKKDAIRSALGGIKSNRFIIEKIYNTEGDLKNLILYGGGWGHNVGLDQSASANMAEEGFTYKEIITHFYPGTKISRIYN
ncbi:MAG: SpoIID/LytB domain-containing protein [Halanaerobiaceae bacterium]